MFNKKRREKIIEDVRVKRDFGGVEYLEGYLCE